MNNTSLKLEQILISFSTIFDEIYRVRFSDDASKTMNTVMSLSSLPAGVLEGCLPCYPLVNLQKTIENGHRNSGFSH